MKYLRIASLVLFIGVAFVLATGEFVLAQSAQQAACEGAGGTWSPSTETCDDGSDGLGDIFQSVINVLLFLLGAVAVIMLVIGGFRFVISGGDSNMVAEAKNTILYAVIGIIVAFLAYAAVNFVMNQLEGGTSGENEEEEVTLLQSDRPSSGQEEFSIL